MGCNCKKGTSSLAQSVTAGITRYTLVFPGTPVIPENIPSNLKFDTLSSANAALRSNPGMVVATFRDV